jgi:hypothetical protein
MKCWIAFTVQASRTSNAALFSTAKFGFWHLSGPIFPPLLNIYTIVTCHAISLSGPYELYEGRKFQEPVCVFHKRHVVRLHMSSSWQWARMLAAFKTCIPPITQLHTRTTKGVWRPSFICTTRQSIDQCLKSILHSTFTNGLIRKLRADTYQIINIPRAPRCAHCARLKTQRERLTAGKCSRTRTWAPLHPQVSTESVSSRGILLKWLKSNGGPSKPFWSPFSRVSSVWRTPTTRNHHKHE